ncbi:MAG: Hsp20/alpha crystallin family protein [Acidobacteriota bacterium]
MADVKVTRESSQQGGTQQPSQQSKGGGSLERRSESMLSPFSLTPRDFFSMNPFQMMRRITEDMDRMFFGREFGGGFWSPPVEIRQQGDHMIVSAELPGLNKEDVHVEITDEGLVISGERKREHEVQEKGYYRSERSYGQFQRFIPLPENAQLDQARASFNNGVLEVSIPAPEAQKKRREVPIETAQTRTSGGGAGA